MRQRFGWRAVVLAACACGLAASARAEEAPRPEKDLVVTQQGGTRYLRLKDWPETRQGGVVRRATLEEYLSMKFGQLAEQITHLQERAAGLEQRLQKLEAVQDGTQARLRLIERPAAERKEAQDAGTTNVSEEESRTPPAAEEP